MASLSQALETQALDTYSRRWPWLYLQYIPLPSLNRLFSLLAGPQPLFRIHHRPRSRLPYRRHRRRACRLQLLKLHPQYLFLYPLRRQHQLLTPPPPPSSQASLCWFAQASKKIRKSLVSVNHFFFGRFLLSLMTGAGIRISFYVTSFLAGKIIRRLRRHSALMRRHRSCCRIASKSGHRR